MIGQQLAARVLIADDDANIRDALRELLESEDGITVVAVTADAAQAIEAAARERPDVAILDVKMPGGGGPHAAGESWPAVPAPASSPSPPTATGPASSRC